MLRQLQPEILDTLPHEDRDAVASRRDLGRINAFMGNWRWLARRLREHVQPGDRVLEVGAGRGEFLSWWTQHAGDSADAVHIRALDLASRPEDWPSKYEWVQTDLTRYDAYADCDVVIANLVLHHLDAHQLAALGHQLARGPRVVLACEPARRGLHLWQLRLLPLLGANRVTRHDAPVSVRAGFRDDELPDALGFERARWNVQTATNWRGAYRLVAVRKHLPPCSRTVPPPQRRELKSALRALDSSRLEAGGPRASVVGGVIRAPAPFKPIEIVGGGLAGLALGRALARAGVPVTVFEAQHYPRHRVCGEFICGLRDDVAEALDLRTMLAGSLTHRTMAWHWRERHVRNDTLPRPAYGISRYALDQRLADAFTAAGGTLHVRTRVDPNETAPGRVWSAGRRPHANGSHWLGLKAHVAGLSLAADLEFHLADGAYVGLTPVEGGVANVCGLFRRRLEVRAPAPTILPAYLRACGLRELAERVEPALERESHAAVAALSFDRDAPADRVALGDAFAMIPPFTGDGMAMAFESAALALPPLLEYARGAVDWCETECTIRRSMRKRFRGRLFAAGLVQQWLVDARGQAIFSRLASHGVLPFRLVFRILH